MGHRPTDRGLAVMATRLSKIYNLSRPTCVGLLKQVVKDLRGEATRQQFSIEAHLRASMLRTTGLVCPTWTGAHHLIQSFLDGYRHHPDGRRAGRDDLLATCRGVLLAAKKSDKLLSLSE